MKPKRFVITGGACAGKSTGMSRICERLENLGYKVFCVPEAATLLIMGGADPRNMSFEEFMEFQTGVMRLQIAMEKSFYDQALKHPGKCVLLMDRGIFDGAAFVSPEIWCQVLESNQITAIVRDRNYDAVIHMVTAAKGAPEFYTLENNKARRETPEEAIEQDEKLIAAWTGHPHLRVINNSGDFEDKIQRVITEVTRVLGEPEPVEEERKFLVEINLEDMAAAGYTRHTCDIIQHYLPSGDEGELRVRRRGSVHGWTYTKTHKRPYPGTVHRFETEEFITSNDYWKILNENPEAPSVQKKRTCFVFEDIYFELDDIPAKGIHILEVETDEEGQLPIPPGIRVIKEVTGDSSYSNSKMALQNA